MNITAKLLVVPLFGFIIGCSSLLSEKPERILEIQKEIIEAPQIQISCNYAPVITPLNLEPYEFIVLPSLSSFGLSSEEVPEYLKDKTGNTWWAVDPYDFEAIDRNDIDKQRLVKELKLLIEFYQDCIKDYNSVLTEEVGNERTTDE